MNCNAQYTEGRMYKLLHHFRSYSTIVTILMGFITCGSITKQCSKYILCYYNVQNLTANTTEIIKTFMYVT